jgi:hypothetical protein
LTIELSLALIARDNILYRLESKLIGRQFFIEIKSPFFGINLIEADLKLVVRCPSARQKLE